MDQVGENTSARPSIFRYESESRGSSGDAHVTPISPERHSPQPPAAAAEPDDREEWEREYESWRKRVGLKMTVMSLAHKLPAPSTSDHGIHATEQIFDYAGEHPHGL